MKCKSARVDGGAIALLFASLAADRLTKRWAVDVLSAQPGGALALLPDVLSLQYAQNTGAAFSLFSGRTPLLIVVTAITLTVVAGVMLFSRGLTRFSRAALALILAGGTGNLADRVLFGHVVDFLKFEFIRFPVFNLADIAITAGAMLFALTVLFSFDRGKERVNP